MRIGTDIVLIARIEKSIANDRFINQVFTEKERKYCRRAENYAGLFAAKEAYLKALGTGIDRRLNTVEILHTDIGKPYVNTTEKCDLSISHDGEYAIAVCIME